jgi:hypothetical protein
MPDHDTTSRALKHTRDEGLIRWALSAGLDPTAAVQVIDDWGTINDRIEFIDARVELAREVEPVEPEVGRIEGRETGLFYRSCVNLLYGTDGCGKTLLMQKLIMQELEAGNEVMYLDAEEGSCRNMVLRLQQMGVDAEWGDRFHYCNLDRQPSQQNRDMFVTVAKNCSLVVIDSAGEFMGMYGKDATKDLETRSVLFEMFGRPLAKAGAAVVILDHIAKSSDGSMPIGSIRKRAAIDGAAYYMSVDEGNEWSKTRGGYANLMCTKDRNGTYFRGEHVSRVQVFPAAVSATGELIVELLWTEFDDITDEELIDHTPPATRPLPDVEALMIEIVQAASSPVRAGYVQSELHLRGVKMSKGKVDEALGDLVKRGWLALDGKAGFTAKLHSV